MARPSFPIDHVLELLALHPARISDAAAGLTPAQLRSAPAAGEWSANDVLAHLRACADVWGRYIREMLAVAHPTIRAVNPRTWLAQTDYDEQAFGSNLDAFAAQRAGLLVVLEALSPAGWERSATLRGAGKPLEQTVRGYAEGMARHERAHVKQIERIVNEVRQPDRSGST